MKLIKKLALRNLKLNKKRTAVTIIGIILAVALLTALSSLVMSFRSSMIEYEKNKNGNFHVSFADLDAASVAELKQNISIDQIFYSTEIGYAVISGSKNTDKPYAYIIGANEDTFSNLCLTLVSGRMAQNGSEIVIPKHLKTNGGVDIEVGDTITLDVGERVSSGDSVKLSQYFPFSGEDDETIFETETKTYTVVGIIERPGYSVEPFTAPGYTFITYCDINETTASNITAYVRFKQVGKCFEYMADIIGADRKTFASSYDSASTTLCTMEERKKVSQQVESSPFGQFAYNQYLIQYERIWPMDSTILTVFIIGCFVGLIIIFTSVYCIKNSFEISVNEKIRQYGMLSGIGATKRQIRYSVLYEAGIMGFIGLGLGVASGLLASAVLVEITNTLLAGAIKIQLVYNASLAAIAAAVLLGMITIYLSAIYGANKAARIMPVEAMRNQNEIKANGKKIKVPGYIAKLFGIGGVISYKNIKRNGRKYRTSVVSIAVCTVTFIITSYFVSMCFSEFASELKEEECNIYVTIYSNTTEAKAKSSFESLDTVEEISVVSREVCYVGKDILTKEYLAVYASSKYDNHFTYVYILDEQTFSNYAKNCGIKNADGQAIVINTYEDSENGKIRVFNLKAGDTLKIYYDYTGENLAGECLIAGTTEQVPFGDNVVIYEEGLVISEKTAENMGFDIDWVKVCFKSSNADSFQDLLEEKLSAASDTYGDRYVITNQEAEVQKSHSLIVLVSIFAYGLITVIALIGVTNIINTLSTGMELRARDFAILRSVGMTASQFEKMALLEAIFTTVKALIFGIVIGTLGAFLIWWYGNSNFTGKIAFEPPVKAAVMCSVTVILLVYMIIRFSLARINKRNIIETIKNENL